MNNKKEYKKGISVIIPTFNRAKYLYSTLICLCNQETSLELNYEIIIVDSGNDKETKSVIEELIDKGNIFIKYRKIQKCKNRSFVRNLGAKKAVYNILCFLDNDILVPRDFIQKIYNEQINRKSQILLCLRRFLTDFNLLEIGEETLVYDFARLEALPWYSDEREAIDLSNNSWRYAFSHTFIINNKDFRAVGGFNNKFGEQWGLEDIELAYRLYKNNFSFIFLENYRVYHQPHFSQSANEQQRIEPNQRLFLKLHNSFEAEIEICFCNFFNEYYNEIMNVQDRCKKNVFNYQKYDLILGMLNSVENNNRVNNKYRLGIVCPFKDKSFKNVLISQNFYLFSPIIQKSILSESFRVAKNLYIEKNNNDSRNLIIQLFYDISLKVEMIEYNGIYKVSQIGKSNKAVMAIQLPDVLQPEKRFFYLWLASRLNELKFQVYLEDIKRIDNFFNEDFSLEKSRIIELNNCIEKSYACSPFKFILSFDNVYVYRMSFIKQARCNFYFMDNGYPFKHNSTLIKAFGSGIRIDKNCYQLLLFSAVFQNIQEFKIPDNDLATENICCFMENGYLEDGIDIILEAFGKIIQKKASSFMTIKMPDYKNLLSKCYPRHNEASKYCKQFSTINKIKKDFFSLEKKILELGLNSRINIIQKNMSFEEILYFINSNGILINASRGSCLSPQVYAAILLRKNVFIAESHFIISPLKKYCNIVPSKIVDFCNEFGVPRCCENLLFGAVKIEPKDLYTSFYNRKHERITLEEIEEITSKTESLLWELEKVDQ